MRITGGIYCRHEIKVPKVGCRPTQDMVREALFSILGARIVNCRFLDLFAGSGAVGLEALSRGAESVCWVESNRRTLALLKGNVERIAGRGREAEPVCKVQFRCGDALTFLQKGLETQQFDLIFADPPYDRDGYKDWLMRILDVLAGRETLAQDGLLVIEQAAEETIEKCSCWCVVKEKVYGNTRLRFIARKEMGA